MHKVRIRSADRGIGQAEILLDGKKLEGVTAAAVFLHVGQPARVTFEVLVDSVHVEADVGEVKLVETEVA